MFEIIDGSGVIHSGNDYDETQTAWENVTQGKGEYENFKQTGDLKLVRVLETYR